MDDLLKLLRTIEERVEREIAADEAQQKLHEGLMALHYQILVSVRKGHLIDLTLIKLIIQNALDNDKESPKM